MVTAEEKTCDICGKEIPKHRLSRIGVLLGMTYVVGPCCDASPLEQRFRRDILLELDQS